MTVDVRTTLEEVFYGDGREGQGAARARAYACMVNGDLVLITLKVNNGHEWLEVKLHQSSKQNLVATLQEMHRSIADVLEELERRGKGGSDGGPSEAD